MQRFGVARRRRSLPENLESYETSRSSSLGHSASKSEAARTRRSEDEEHRTDTRPHTSAPV